MGFKGGVNLYSYVGNTPLNRTDPSGLNPALMAFLLRELFREMVENCPRRLPDNVCRADQCCSGRTEWKEYTKEQSVLHNPEQNVKLGGISPDKVGQECVYNRNTGALETDPRYKGTYNFSPPEGYGEYGQGGSDFGHSLEDVIPFCTLHPVACLKTQF
jgi:hypothetical protein